MGDINKLKFGYESSQIWNEKECLKTAAAGGSVECLEFVLSVSHRISKQDMIDACLSAAKNGHASILSLLFEKGVSPREEMFEAAIKGKSIKCVRIIRRGPKSLWKKWKSPKITEYLVNVALRSGSLQLVRYFRRWCSTRVEWSKPSMGCCIRDGYYDCLIYAVAHGASTSPNMYVTACLRGDLRFLRLLREGYIDPNSGLKYTLPRTWRPAEWKGLEFDSLFESGLKFDMQTLRYLREGPKSLEKYERGPFEFEPVPWSERVCKLAGKKSLEALKYLREGPESRQITLRDVALGRVEWEPCPWNRKMYSFSVLPECREYARAHGCPE
jgi:hypothetical protein